MFMSSDAPITLCLDFNEAEALEKISELGLALAGRTRIPHGKASATSAIKKLKTAIEDAC
jgi:hypothetical protein